MLENNVFLCLPNIVKLYNTECEKEGFSISI